MAHRNFATAAALDGAEAAAARAHIAEQHQRGRARAPALPDIGTARLFADGAQLELTEQALQTRMPLAAGERHL